MIEKIGLAALVILIATETFAVSEAVLWSLTAALHMGAAAATGALAASVIFGAGAGFGIFRLSRASERTIIDERDHQDEA